MKKIIFFYNLLLITLAGVTSCKHEADEPAPTVKAQFTQNVQVTERYENVTFTNTSLNAKHYKWDFGNGVTSIKKNPAIHYYHPGTYTVRMMAYDNLNTPSVAYGTVKVGRKHITKIEIERLDPISGYGYPWDPQDGPDLYMRITAKEKPNWIYSPVYYDVPATAFPVSWEYLPNVVMGEEETWIFELYDQDLPFPAENIIGPVIQSVAYTTKTDSGAKGFFIYEQREARMKIHFDVK